MAGMAFASTDKTTWFLSDFDKRILTINARVNASVLNQSNEQRERFIASRSVEKFREASSIEKPMPTGYPDSNAATLASSADHIGKESPCQQAVAKAIKSCAYRELRKLEVVYSGSAVYLFGCVSSFFMKQMAQEIVRRCAPHLAIRNHVVVETEPVGRPNTGTYDATGERLRTPK